jgi:hypothetical protein
MMKRTMQNECQPHSTNNNAHLFRYPAKDALLSRHAVALTMGSHGLDRFQT